MGWVRSGECPPERCQGRCCTHTGVWLDASVREIKDFLKLQQVRGLSVFTNGSSLALLDMPQTCQYLTGEGLCGLHPSMNPNHNLPTRPDYCEEWPTEPAQLIADPYCGFTFSWQDEPIGVQANV